MVSSGAVSKLNVVGFSKAAAKVRGREGDRADGSTRLPCEGSARDSDSLWVEAKDLHGG
jgi:hypothetical protein